MKESFKELAETIAEHTEQRPGDELVLASVRERLQEATRRPAGRAPLRRMLQAAVVLGVACGTLFVFKGNLLDSEPLSLLDSEPLSVVIESQPSVLIGDWITSQEETKRLRFSDGTSVSLLPATDILVREITPEGATVMLGRGRTLAQVEPKQGAKWRFLAGPFAVRVTGTEFDLAWDPGQGVLELALHHGSVVLSGPTLAQPRTVKKGEFVRVEIARSKIDPTGKTTDDGTSPSDGAVASDGAAPAVESESNKAPPHADDLRENWRQLLFGGDRSQALQAVAQAGTARVLANATAAELSRLSQIARLGGQPTLARDTLLALRDRFEQQGQTAYLLGKVHADQLGDIRKAVQWFETYLKENPGGTLREQAMGRLVHLQAGGSAGKTAASRYLAEYPNGSFASFARSL